MQPKLAVLNGPLGKTEFPIAELISIGRDSSNSICLGDLAVSPNHCRITADNGRFLLTDLDSTSGTFVNGIPVKERVLAPGDQIAVGNSVFLLRVEAAREAASSPVELDEYSSVRGQVQQLRHDELLYLHPESLAALPQSERLARTLSTLIKISTTIGSIRDVESLQWQLLGMIFDVIPAERGAILLASDTVEEISSLIGWDRVSGPDHPVHVSRALAYRVMEEQIAVLEKEDPELSSSSVLEFAGREPIRSLLCVPLAAAGQALGVIYVDSCNPLTAFTKDDLQLLAGIAGLAAIAIENARQFERLGDENQQLRAEVSLHHDMVGQSPRMHEVYKFIERVAPSDSTVLIYGESGTGKELAARAIHKNSQRKDKPFVALNCAALTETLLESELFGHEKGAFTSAICQKKGLLEVAEEGSVFLDEVGELPLTLQAKLLRVLQEREFVRVGGTRSLKLNVRFLAATNKDLQKAVREEKFRPDLFHRLNVISLSLPPLRQHPEDIALLAEHFAARYAKKCNRNVKGFSPEARACLMQYDWPGNIRELENAMERAIVIGSSDFIFPEDLPETLLETAPTSATASTNYHHAIRHLKKQLILNAFEQAGGSITETAKVLGVHSNYLHRLIRNLDLRLALKKSSKS
ncbi:MAG TPA: sigma 54-interacting transcriptional regulator [Candidatus Acidoferrum sp.]|nr:sigma 54-interacting transcriptional regulator [Candidatus Acidoferrum sp.]